MVRRCGAFVIAAVALLVSAPPASAGPVFGFNDPYSVPGAEQDARLNQREASAGAKVNRIVVSWADVERRLGPDGNPVQEWDRSDRRIASIRASGMRPLIIVMGSPPWTRRNLLDPCLSLSVFCPPDPAYLRNWERFNYQVAKRYPDAAAIEIWNEPNWWGFWATRAGPDPRRYAQLFKRAAGAIHFAEPSIPVLVGSLAYSVKDREPGNKTIPTFLEGFAEAGGFGAIRPRDGIGVHAYPWIDEMETLDTQFAAIMRQIRAARDRWSPGTGIWVTETGVTTTGPNSVSERQQARTILLVLRELLDDADLEAVLIHTSMEPPSVADQPAEEGLGVLHPDLTAKPAYCALLERAKGGSSRFPGCPRNIAAAIGMDPGDITSDGTSDASLRQRARAHCRARYRARSWWPEATRPERRAKMRVCKRRYVLRHS